MMDSSLSLDVQQKFYNSFYALRLKIIIKDHSIKLDHTSTPPHLHCDSFTPHISFPPLLHQLKPLLVQHGVSTIVRCFSDPLPLLEVSFDSPESIKNLLNNIGELTPHIWILVWDMFFKKAKKINSSLLKGEDDDVKTIDGIRLQHMFRSGNSCHLDLLFFSPNSSIKEVRITPVTLANYHSIAQAMASSLVFSFQSAMNTFYCDKSSLQHIKESVSLTDLNNELEGLTNWFHMGIVTKLPLSALLNILLNFRHRGTCTSQMLSLWYSQNTNAHGENQLTWTNVARVMVTIGNKSIANHIVQHYSLSNNAFEPLRLEDMSAHGRLLSDPVLKGSVKATQDIEEQISEKMRILTLYYQQKKALEISMDFLKNELSDILNDIHYVLKMRAKSTEEQTKSNRNIAALKIALRCLGCKEAGLEEEEEINKEELEGEIKDMERDSKVDTERVRIDEKGSDEEMDKDPIIQAKQNLQDLMHKLISLQTVHSEDHELAVTQLNTLVPQLMKSYEKLIKEFQLLLSKSLQIHQLQGIVGLMQVSTLTHTLKIDHFLQGQVASKTKSDAIVLQILHGVTEVEMAEKESELATVLNEKEEDILQNVTETQENLDKKVAYVTDWMKKLQSGKGKEAGELKDEELEQLLQQVEDTEVLQSTLLKAKLNSWSTERGRKITGAEKKVLQQLLDSLSKVQISIEDTPQQDSAPSTIEETNHPSALVECHLSPNEVAQVKMNQFIKFIISTNELLKLNPKKHTYTAEIRALADDSSKTNPLVFDTTTSPSTLTVVFQPIVRGRHQLLIKSNNKSIKGLKPYSIYASQPPNILGYPVRIIDSLNYPYNACPVPNSSTILVSECKGQCVTLLDKVTGKRLMTIGGPGSSVQLKLPNGIAVDKQGLVYIVDSGSHCIYTFTLEGIPVDKIGGKGSECSMFCFPYGIEISPRDGTINICDHNNDRVQIFSHERKFQRVLYAITPYDMAFDRNGCMYVTDHHNHLVAVFNESFQCINSFAGRGTEEGKLMEPRGIVIDEQGFIYVVEEMNCRVSIFNANGEFVTCFGQGGSQPGEFAAPQGVAIDEDGYVYVCDMLNNRVQVF